MELFSFEEVQVVTLDDLKKELSYGMPIGYPIPEGEKLLFTDFVGKFPCKSAKDKKTTCFLAIKASGDAVPVSFSALTRWGYVTAPESESAPIDGRTGMFSEVRYSDLFANQLMYSGKIIDTTKEQTLFVPKYDKATKSFCAPYTKGKYPLCTITNDSVNDAQKQEIQKLLNKFVSCLGTFKKDGE